MISRSGVGGFSGIFVVWMFVIVSTLFVINENLRKCRAEKSSHTGFCSCIRSREETRSLGKRAKNNFHVINCFSYFRIVE